jgi:hypothetical protein
VQCRKGCSVDGWDAHTGSIQGGAYWPVNREGSMGLYRLLQGCKRGGDPRALGLNVAEPDS